MAKIVSVGKGSSRYEVIIAKNAMNKKNLSKDVSICLLTGMHCFLRGLRGLQGISKNIQCIVST